VSMLVSAYATIMKLVGRIRWLSRLAGQKLWSSAAPEIRAGPLFFGGNLGVLSADLYSAVGCVLMATLLPVLPMLIPFAERKR